MNRKVEFNKRYFFYAMPITAIPLAIVILLQIDFVGIDLLLFYSIFSYMSSLFIFDKITFKTPADKAHAIFLAIISSLGIAVFFAAFAVLSALGSIGP